MLTVLICIAVSACIETVQLIFRIGLFEADDILSNGTGGLIGAMIGAAFRNTRGRKIPKGHLPCVMK